jgi:hypothetical protein
LSARMGWPDACSSRRSRPVASARRRSAHRQHPVGRLLRPADRGQALAAIIIRGAAASSGRCYLAPRWVAISPSRGGARWRWPPARVGTLVVLLARMSLEESMLERELGAEYSRNGGVPGGSCRGSAKCAGGRAILLLAGRPGITRWLGAAIRAEAGRHRVGGRCQASLTAGGGKVYHM